MSSPSAGAINFVIELSPEQSARVLAILESYLAELEGGARPDTEAVVSRHPELAAVLRSYLGRLDLLHHAAAALRGPSLPAPEPPAPEGTVLGDFRVLRELGRGGMGVVYEAEQLSLSRRVALKVLPLAAALDDRQLQRFRTEAQAAALLHHPHIAPVYAVGCAGGVHYYAMRYLDGPNLAAVIARLRRAAGLDPPVPPADPVPAGPHLPPLTAAESLPPQDGPAPADLPAALAAGPAGGAAYYREVARLGVQAARALAHAHSQGVLHRDVKPANLLLDGTGALYVADFGLARLQAEAGPTRTGEVVGTLRYMSPEQTLGRPTVVDQRADVYALGATLYELLTLHCAVTGQTREELLRHLASAEPRPLRKHDHAIPAALERVVLKALAREPQRRYRTAGELGDDLERFLDDQAVLARRPTLGERTGRWARRHKAVVGAVIVGLVLAVIGLATSNMLILEAKRRAEAAYRAQVIEQQRLTANLHLTFQALDETFLQVAEQRLPRDPQWRQETQKLLRKGLRFYERLAEMNGHDPAARHQAGTAYRRIGDIQDRLGQQVRAERAYRQAIVVLQQLAADYPRLQVYQQDLAACHHNLAGLLWATGRLKKAEEAIHQESQLLERLAAADPRDPWNHKQLGQCRHNLSLLLQATGRPRQAEKVLRQSQPALERLVATFPTWNDFRVDLALNQDKLAQLLASSGRAREAEQAYRRALDLLEPLARLRVPSYQTALGIVYHNAALLFRDTGRVAEAEKAHRRSVEVLERLTADYPNVPDYKKHLGLALHQLGVVLVMRGQRGEAEQVYRRALDLLEPLVRTFPDKHEYQKELAVTQNNLGIILQATGRVPEAVQAYRRARELFVGLAVRFPTVPDFQSYLGGALGNLAALAARQGQWTEVRRLAKLAIKHQLAALKANPRQQRYHEYLRGHRATLAEAIRHLDRSKKSS